MLNRLCNHATHIPLKRTFAKHASNLKKFTTLQQERKKSSQNDQEMDTYGRAWHTNELRIKSTPDLHKLWHVLQIEKNALLSDDKLLSANSLDEKMTQERLKKVKTSMRRIYGVVTARNNIQKSYRRKIEDDYIEKKRDEELQRRKELDETEPIVELPKVEFELLRKKYRDLRRGVDNTDYIKRALAVQAEKRRLTDTIHEKYNYSEKELIEADQEIPEGEDPENYLRKFKSMAKQQLKSGELYKTNQEVLAAHVKNWKSLTLRQRRQVAQQINVRRVKDAKIEFFKELDLLGQKIAYDKAQAVKGGSTQPADEL